MQPLPLLRRLPALLFLFALLVLAGCGGHGGGHKASAKETLAAVRQRGHFSGSIASEDRAPLSTEADFILNGGVSGAATFRQIDQAKPNDVPLSIYRADITNVVIDSDGSADGTGPISFDLVNFSVGSGRKPTDKLGFIGRFQWDGSGFRILNGLVGTPAGVQLNFTQKDRLLPTKGSGGFADARYAGSLEKPGTGDLVDWSGLIEQNDDAHVHMVFNSGEGNAEFDMVDAGNTLQGEFDGVKWGYGKGDTVQVYVRRDATGSTVGFYKVIDAYGTGRASGRITLLKGIDPAAINAGYYEGTLSPTAQGDGAKTLKLGTVPVRFDVASTTGSPFGAVLLTPKSSEPSVAGGIRGVTKTTLAVLGFTGAYSRIDFTKTNKSATEISGKYRAELADGHTIEAGTFTVKKATPSVLASSIVGKTLTGKLKATDGGATDATLGTNADGGAYPTTIGFVTPFLGTHPALRGYAVGDAFAVFAPGNGDFQGAFSGTVKAGVPPTVTGRYTASATVDGTRKTQSGTLALGSGASASDLRTGVYTGHVALDGYAIDAVEFRLESSGGTPQGALFSIVKDTASQIEHPKEVLSVESLKADGEGLALEMRSADTGLKSHLTLKGKVSGERFTGTASLDDGGIRPHLGTFDLSLSMAPRPTPSGEYQAAFSGTDVRTNTPVTVSGPVAVSGSGLSISVSVSAKPLGVAVRPIALLYSGQYGHGSETHTETVDGKAVPVRTEVSLHVLSADEFAGLYEAGNYDGQGNYVVRQRGTVHATRGGGGGGGAFSAGLYSGSMTPAGSTTAKGVRLDVASAASTLGAQGAVVLLANNGTVPNVGGRVEKVTGDAKSVTVQIGVLSAVYNRMYFNGSVTGGVFSGTYVAVKNVNAPSEEGTFSLTLDAHPTRPDLSGTWALGFGGSTTSTATFVQTGSEITVTPNATLGGVAVPPFALYVAGGHLAGRAQSAELNADFYGLLDSTKVHFEGSYGYDTGTSSNGGAFVGTKTN